MKQSTCGNGGLEISVLSNFDLETTAFKFSSYTETGKVLMVLSKEVIIVFL